MRILYVIVVVAVVVVEVIGYSKRDERKRVLNITFYLRFLKQYIELFCFVDVVVVIVVVVVVIGGTKCDECKRILNIA